MPVSGPLFDGRASAALHRYTVDMPQKIADEGQQMVRTHLNAVLKQNRGVYVGRVVVLGEGETQIIENDMVYSPWLEGIDERNRSTRFGGYHTFRIVGQQLDAKAEPLANEILQPYLREMN